MRIFNLNGCVAKEEIFSEVQNRFCTYCNRKNSYDCQVCNIYKILGIIGSASETSSFIKKAKWEICSDGYYPYCSNCKEEPQGKVMTDYCPNCGAYMKGDKGHVMTEHEQEVYDNILKENARKTGIKMF